MKKKVAKFIFLGNLLWASKKLVKATNLISLFFIVFSFSKPEKLQGQEQISSQYTWFDNVTGITNSGLFNGIAYNNVFNVRNRRHQFFKSSNFQNGNVTYYGQAYFNLALKYDVFNDEVIIKNQELLGLYPMVFDSEGLASFSIGMNQFITVKGGVLGKNSGFYEILFKTEEVTLLKKHKKQLFVKTDEEIVFHEFKDAHFYYLKKGLEFYKIKTGKELSSIYPSNKKLIKTLRERHDPLRKSDFDNYLSSILADFIKVTTNNKSPQ